MATNTFNQNVVRLDISMHDAILMKIVHSLQQLPHDVLDEALIVPVLLWISDHLLLKVVTQSTSSYHLNYKIVVIRILVKVEDFHDIGMIG